MTGGARVWTTRRAATSAAIFFLLLVAGTWPWSWVAKTFSVAYCPLANLMIAPQTFGRGGHARLVPLPEVVRRPTDSVTADTGLSLSVAGFSGYLQLGLSLRRDAYLPLWILIALLAAGTLPMLPRRRLKAFLIAIPIQLAVNLAALQLTIVWTLAFQLNGIYDRQATALRLIDLAYGALLTPPGNRFIVPLGLGIAIIVWLGGVDTAGGFQSREALGPDRRDDVTKTSLPAG